LLRTHHNKNEGISIKVSYRYIILTYLGSKTYLERARKGEQQWYLAISHGAWTQRRAATFGCDVGGHPCSLVGRLVRARWFEIW
jgi:hypothetical protein